MKFFEDEDEDIVTWEQSMAEHLKTLSLEQIRDYYPYHEIDNMSDDKFSESIDVTDDWDIIPLNQYGSPMTKEDIKERKLFLKRKIIEREMELGVWFDKRDLPELLGYGHYRVDKGYNKYGEYCCNKCKEFKPRTIEYYPKDYNRRDQLGYTCRECLKKYSKEYYHTKVKPAKEKIKNKESQSYATGAGL